MPADRSDFLKSAYEQMFRDVAQHYTVVWQSAATVFGAFAIFALAEKGIVPIDVAVAINLLLCSWFVANILECSYWYNRNLVIIANIERQFLDANDLKNVHYYFGAHRPDNRMISHLKNQMFLAAGLFSVVIGYHFFTRVAPGLSAEGSTFDAIRALPYAVACASAAYLWNLHDRRNISYAEFVKNSPGRTVDTTGIQYGIGHGFKA